MLWGLVTWLDGYIEEIVEQNSRIMGRKWIWVFFLKLLSRKNRKCARKRRKATVEIRKKRNFSFSWSKFIYWIKRTFLKHIQLTIYLTMIHGPMGAFCYVLSSITSFYAGACSGVKVGKNIIKNHWVFILAMGLLSRVILEILKISSFAVISESWQQY